MTHFPPTVEQLAIMDAARSSDANLMIFALAGTGKTTAIELLVPHLPTKSILLLAFNKKNCLDLEKVFIEPRGENKELPPLAPWVVVKSFNALGHRAFASATGRRLILDDRKIARLTTAYTKKLGGVSDDEWGNLSNLVKRAKMLGLVPARYPQARRSLLPDDSWGWESAADALNIDLTEALMVGARQILCEAIDLALAGTIDFDDQIYMSCLFSGLYQKFHTVICDESQDISHLNRLQLMKSCGQRLIIAGDQKQGIYAFRGADSSSMRKIKELKPDWIDLPLTVTWRCPKVVVARQLGHAPQYTAAPEAPAGRLLDWRDQKQWTLPSAAESVMPNAILCRNNAPLISLAFSLIRKRIGIKVLGRDFGKSLTTLVKKIAGTKILGVDEFVPAFTSWKEKEMRLANAADKPEKGNRVEDQYESIMAVIESSGDITTVRHIISCLEQLFEAANGQITLSTGHKAKGLEWHCVLHLDPWRIPSKWARNVELEQPWLMEQEMNLQYVIETRAKDTLILANLEQFV